MKTHVEIRLTQKEATALVLAGDLWFLETEDTYPELTRALAKIKEARK